MSLQDDQEIAAIAAIAGILAELDEGSRGRVVRWASERYGGASALGGQRSAGPGSEPTDASRWRDVFDLVGSVDARTDADRAMLVAYWLQVEEQSSFFTGAQVNDLLRQMGKPASNIAHVFSRLISRKPPFVQQIAKSGRARQARKQYRLTTLGVDYVTRLLDDDTTRDER